MPKQRARVLGATAQGLVKPGTIFEDPVLQDWADPVSDQEALADLDRKIAEAQADAREPERSTSGSRVVPGSSSPTKPAGRASKPRRAETP